MPRAASHIADPLTGDAPVVSPIHAYLDQLHTKYVALREGDVATYIPELAKADPEWFGICVATTDGHVYEIGDTRQLFTIQSISKPFVYGLALEDRGRAAVLAKIGAEPTGDAFNSISLAPGTGCPLNPMINAGAIAAASLVAGHSPEDKFERVRTAFSTYAGRSLTLDRAVFESERETGHRNRAIGHMLRNFDIITSDPEPALNLYFQQCSIAVDCRDLAVMAATLANGGVNPRTGERAVRLELVDSILSVMTTCGMYDYAGEWVYWVGLPAKSGVAGGVLAVLPGQLGIGVFSPRLDSRGNSVRGVAVCKELSRKFNLHFLRAPRPAYSVIRAQHTLVDISSKRRRSAAERQVLDSVGERVRVYDLQGDLPFAAVENVVRTLVDASPRLDCRGHRPQARRSHRRMRSHTVPTAHRRARDAPEATRARERPEASQVRAGDRGGADGRRPMGSVGRLLRLGRRTGMVREATHCPDPSDPLGRSADDTSRA